MSAERLRADILRYLYQRVSADGPRYTTLGRMRREMNLNIAGEFLKVLLDDLEFGGYITARNSPNYGKDLVQISAKGLDWVDDGHQAPSIDSTKWTGTRRPIRLTGKQADALVEELIDVEARLSELPITNAEKSQARAYLIAARVLAETPEPPGEIIWDMIARAAQIATIASLLAAVYTIMKMQP